MGINYFGNISQEELAQELIKYPELYSSQTNALQKSASLKILNPEIDLESSLNKLNKANQIANKGRIFIFDYEDGYLNQQSTLGYYGQIFQFYKLIGEKMIGIQELNNHYPDFDESVKRLKSKNIEELFTGKIPEKGYFGLKSKWFDEDKDGYWLKKVTDIKNFKEEGIQIIDLGVLK